MNKIKPIEKSNQTNNNNLQYRNKQEEKKKQAGEFKKILKELQNKSMIDEKV